MRSLRWAAAVSLLAAPCFVFAQASDPAAALYLEQCGACHSVTGEPSDSVDLAAVGQRPVEEVADAVRRMQDNAGPLTEEQINGLVALLKSPDLAARIKAAENAPPADAAVATAPASAEIGKRLFFGEDRLALGASACSACHAAEGEGGTLARDLTAVHARLGQTALLSAIQKPAFPLMKPHYATKAPTPQEAADLTAYLASIAKAAPPQQGKAAPPSALLPAAGAFAFLVFGGTAVVFGRRRAGMRSRLVRRFFRRS